MAPDLIDHGRRIRRAYTDGEEESSQWADYLLTTHARTPTRSVVHRFGTRASRWVKRDEDHEWMDGLTDG